MASNCMYHISFCFPHDLFVDHGIPKQLRNAPIQILEMNPLTLSLAVATPIALSGTNRTQTTTTHPHNKADEIEV